MTFLLEICFGLLWWVLLFPVVWVVSLPFVLVIALFRDESYPAAVSQLMSSVHAFWEEWGILLTP